MNLGQLLLARRGTRTGLMLLALGAGLLLAIGAESVLVRIAGILVGIMLAVLVKVSTEMYLLARKAPSSRPGTPASAPTDGRDRLDGELARALAQLDDVEHRVATLDESVEQLLDRPEPTRRHVLHNGPGMRELRLRDAMDALRPMQGSAGSIVPDQELGSKEPTSGGSIVPNA